MSYSIAIVVLFVSFAYFYAKRSLRYLRFYQQEQYIQDRFLGWLRRGINFDRRTSLILLAIAVLSLCLKLPAIAVLFVSAISLVILAKLELDPTKVGKIRLKMTERATRIYRVAFGLFLFVLLSYGVLGTSGHSSGGVTALLFVFVVLVQLVPFLIVAADILLDPYEKKLQQNFIKEAKDILSTVDPLVVGITGSYGKTSTKSILSEVIQVSLGPTFFPPDGVNSPMGITRQIREKMKPHHKFAVIEMGAFKRGSIERLCNLTPPKVGVITAIGEMHLDRFGSAENVYIAKTELAKAIPEDGILVCNGDNEGARRAATEFPKKTTILYGVESSDVDCHLKDIKISTEGSSFSISWKGVEYRGQTKLLGPIALSNLCAAFATACALGADPEYVLASVHNVKPVSNRLELTRHGGIIQLNDAYNSNPVGFRAALDVLDELPGKRKILVTPGMIELGERQFEENKNVAVHAAGICDIIALVGDTNRAPFLEGLRTGGASEKDVLLFEDRDQAFSKLTTMYQDGDVILVENDLPDLYEAHERF